MIGDADRTRRDGGGAPSAMTGAATTATEPRHSLRRVDSVALLSGAREIEIEHRGKLYRLRCTSKGKLILTK